MGVLVQGWAVVTNVQETSVAAEDDKVEIGDIITHVNGVSVVGSSSTEKMVNLISDSKRKPVTLTVTKCFDTDSYQLFPPIVPLLKTAGLHVEDLQRKYYLTRRGARKFVVSGDDEFNPLDDSDDEDHVSRVGYTCLYIGSVNVGCSGDYDRIEFGITRVLSCLPSTCGHVSVLQLSDMELRLFRHVSDDIILRYIYPQIASCGRLVSKPNYFAFIS